MKNGKMAAVVFSLVLMSLCQNAFCLIAVYDEPSGRTNCIEDADEVYSNIPGRQIQDAINSAEAGDEIVICPGLYSQKLTVTKVINEPIENNNKITIRGYNDPYGIIESQQTIFDGHGISGRIMTINSTGTGKVELQNLIFKNGTEIGHDNNGGAILNEGRLVVDHCVLKSNSAASGGAIHSKGNIQILNCEISGNNSVGTVEYPDGERVNYGGKGAGLYLEIMGVSSCRNTFIQSNEAIRFGDSKVEGGGMYLGSAFCGARMDFENVIVDYNFVGHNGNALEKGASGIHIGNPNNLSCEIEANFFNVDFLNNGSFTDITFAGGALEADGKFVVSVESCIFAYNAVGPKAAAAFYGSDDGNSIATINNSEFYYNTSPGEAVIERDGLTTVNVNNSKIQNNSSYIYSTDWDTRHVLDVTKLVNCLVIDNTAVDDVVMADVIINSTIYNNRSVDGLFAQVSGSPILLNSIVWHNDYLNGRIISGNFGAGSSNSFVKDASPGVPNTPVYNGNLLVVRDNYNNSGSNDYSLPQNSQAVNAGDGSFLPGEASSDVAGKNRVYGSEVDIGAYEYQGPAPRQLRVINGEGGYAVCFSDQSYLNATIVGNGKSETVIVNDGASPFCNIIAEEYADISEVKVQAVPQGPLAKVTINAVSEDVLVEVEYSEMRHQILTNVSGGLGNIYPTNPMVLHGRDQEVRIEPAEGNYILSVSVDDELIEGVPEAYVFKSVKQENHHIDVVFDACQTQTTLMNHILRRDFSKIGGTSVISYMTLDGFGQMAQTQIKENDGDRLVGGLYKDDFNRQTHIVKPFIYTQDENKDEYLPVNMHCKELIGEADTYFQNRLGDKRAYKRTMYETSSIGNAIANGRPGRNYSIEEGKFERRWLISASTSSSFISPAAKLLNSEFLDNKAIAYKLNSKYTLEVLKDADGKFTQKIYNRLGQIVKERKYSHINNEDANNVTSYFRSNLHGSNERSVPPLGGDYVETKTYNSLNQLIERDAPDDGITMFKYDVNGRLVFTKTNKQSKLDDASHDFFTINTYDDQGRLRMICENNGIGDFEDPVNTSDCFSDDRTPAILMFYDAITTDDVLAVNPALSRNDIDEIVKMLVVSIGSKVAEVSYGDGVAKVWDFYSYDSRGNADVNIKIIPEYGVSRHDFKYDISNNISTQTHYKLEGAWDYLYAQKFLYNEFHELEKIQNRFSEGDAWEDVVTYEFNDHGTLKYVKYYKPGDTNSVENILYEYNIQDWPTKIQAEKKAANSFRQDIDYTGQYSGNIASNTFTYNYSDGGTPKAESFRLGYDYDDLHRLTYVQDGVSNKRFESIYAYDKNDRLISKIEGTDNDPVSNYYLNDYKYDPKRNRLRSIEDSDDYSNPNNFVYDPNGNLVLDRSKNMTVDYNSMGMAIAYNFYDNLPVGDLSWKDVENNNLESEPWNKNRESVVSMLYDSRGYRVVKSNERDGYSEISYYDGAYFEQIEKIEISAETRSFYTNITSINGVIGRVINPKNEHKVYMYLKDNLGSVRLVIDEDGKTVNAIMYQSFGIEELLFKSSDFKQTNKYTGKELDEDGSVRNGVGLYYFGGRYYNPITANWSSTDGMRQFASLYSYTFNPISSKDVDGNYIIFQKRIDDTYTLESQVWADLAEECFLYCSETARNQLTAIYLSDVPFEIFPVSMRERGDGIQGGFSPPMDGLKAYIKVNPSKIRGGRGDGQRVFDIEAFVHENVHAFRWLTTGETFPDYPIPLSLEFESHLIGFEELRNAGYGFSLSPTRDRVYQVYRQDPLNFYNFRESLWNDHLKLKTYQLQTDGPYYPTYFNDLGE